MTRWVDPLNITHHNNAKIKKESKTPILKISFISVKKIVEMLSLLFDLKISDVIKPVQYNTVIKINQSNTCSTQSWMFFADLFADLKNLQEPCTQSPITRICLHVVRSAFTY